MIDTRKKRILFVGCSHTADSGFTEENQPKYHWPWLLSNHYDCYFQNAAIGGCSNDEIFYRCNEFIHSSQCDLVVVLWSNIGRKWIYFEDNNVDDFTIINNGRLAGVNCNHPGVIEYTKLHYSYFDNKFIEIKHWLLQTLSLASTLQELNLPFVFIKGFDNYINDLLSATVLPCGFDLSNGLKNILDFDHRPDYYIAEKLRSLKTLLDKTNQNYWLNFDTEAFTSSCYQLDLADDQIHHGPKSNQKLFQDLVVHIEKRRLIRTH